MRKDSPNTNAFISRAVVKKVKLLSQARGWRQYEVIDVFVRALVDALERGQRPVLNVPAYPPEKRGDTKGIALDRDLNKRVRIQTIVNDTEIRSLVRLALEEGLEQEERRPGSLIAQRQPEDTSTRAITLRAPLVDAIKEIAAQRGTTIVGLTDAVLRVVVQTPNVLDSIALPSARDIPASPAIEAAARSAILKAEALRNGKASPVVRARRQVEHKKKSKRT